MIILNIRIQREQNTYGVAEVLPQEVDTSTILARGWTGTTECREIAHQKLDLALDAMEIPT